VTNDSTPSYICRRRCSCSVCTTRRSCGGAWPTKLASSAHTVRARPGRLSALSVPQRSANPFCMGLLCGRAGRLTAKNGGFRPGQFEPLGYRPGGLGRTTSSRAPSSFCSTAPGSNSSEFISSSVGVAVYKCSLLQCVIMLDHS
jgi:hypothetical protein